MKGLSYHLKYQQGDVRATKVNDVVICQPDLPVVHRERGDLAGMNPAKYLLDHARPWTLLDFDLRLSSFSW